MKPSDKNNYRSCFDFSDDLNNHSPDYIFTTNWTVGIVFAVIGTIINVWFLAAMLKSPEIRSGMRKIVLCVMLAVNISVSAITLPVILIQDILRYNRIGVLDVCIVPIVVVRIEDFIGNWYMFILACVYTAQVVNFVPRLAPLWTKIFTVVSIISPIVVGFFLERLTSNRVYALLETIVPHSLTSLLLVVTAVLKYRRYPYVRLFDEFTDDRCHIDPLYPFVALLVGAVVSGLSQAIFMISLPFLPRNGHFVLFVCIHVRFLRIILVPVMLLLFPDIKKQIKTWRPCARSAPCPENLVVIYEKNAA
ncbi:unnamed protein product [Candidula unifasciata]|uniref:Uncharacterized protein n=1 Tax=Candidula unifasciata TaxID=100452 RepID=A0A8S3Z330_9EUPU|nr:unnamed protein product [Candidula unifasciata]